MSHQNLVHVTFIPRWCLHLYTFHLLTTTHSTCKFSIYLIGEKSDTVCYVSWLYIQWPHLNMLLDAEIYITVYIISSLVLRPPPLLPFNCIHSTQAEDSEKRVLWMQTGDLGMRLDNSQAPLQLLGHSLRPKPTPVWMHFQHSGNETNLPHINFTLTMIIHHSQLFYILLCVIVNTQNQITI